MFKLSIFTDINNINNFKQFKNVFFIYFYFVGEYFETTFWSINLSGDQVDEAK